MKQEINKINGDFSFVNVSLNILYIKNKAVWEGCYQAQTFAGELLCKGDLRDETAHDCIDLCMDIVHASLSDNEAKMRGPY